MSSGFSNTDTAGKPADPYTQANKDTSITTQDKVDALTKFVKSCKFGMMTTRDQASGKLVSRCMAIAAEENNGIDYLFFTNTESHKTDELKSDPHVNLAFLDSSGQWASVAGTTSIETDRSVIKKYYSPTLKAWMGDLGDGKHDGSENDPRIGVIRVKMTTATYAITDRTILGRVAEVAKGMVTGEQANVNNIREVTEEEVRAQRS
ncbi:bli-3 [Xylaria bambusicola]|uniref:bli-3 n=1 Tax=Xylaria bambusicola TaxID=326684 RepID=UPI002008D329|nr:bli-3 [Xylaria bambusicola]KAI0520740.1 bli-3 [Xylaria bambusicola]